MKARDGSARVEGILAVSRAFGNAGIKKFVDAIPEIFEFPISKCSTMVLLTDGITDVIPTSKVSQVVSKAIEDDKRSRTERIKRTPRKNAEDSLPVSLSLRNERTASQVLTSLSIKRRT